MRAPEVSVVIPFFNDIDDLRAACESLLATSDRDGLEVIVADNSHSASAVEQAAALCRKHGWTHIPMGGNAGFARACNRGARQAGGKFLFMLNQDARVEPDTIAILVDHLEDHPETAAVAPAIVTADDRIWFVGGRYRRWLGRLSMDEFGDPWTPGDARPTRFLTGSAVMFRTAAFAALGGFDENYFLYYEDVDLSERLRADGWQLDVVRRARVVHLRGRHGDSLRNLSPLMLEHTVRSRILFGRTRPSRAARMVAGLTVPIEMLRLAFHAIRARPGETLASLRAIGRGVRKIGSTAEPYTPSPERDRPGSEERQHE